MHGVTRVVCFAHCTSINGKTQLPGMQITLPVTVTESLTQSVTAQPGVAPGNGSIHTLLLYYRPHNMGLRLRHTSLFLTYVLAPLCAISNFNYEQVNQLSGRHAVAWEAQFPEARIAIAI